MTQVRDGKRFDPGMQDDRHVGALSSAGNFPSVDAAGVAFTS
jgi:hypothetical protein